MPNVTALELKWKTQRCRLVTLNVNLIQHWKVKLNNLFFSFFFPNGAFFGTKSCDSGRWSSFHDFVCTEMLKAITPLSNFFLSSCFHQANRFQIHFWTLCTFLGVLHQFFSLQKAINSLIAFRFSKSFFPAIWKLWPITDVCECSVSWLAGQTLSFPNPRRLALGHLSLFFQINNGILSYRYVLSLWWIICDN